MLYQFNASREYNPAPNLEKITAAVLAINSADDVVNPPELGLMEKLMPRGKRGKYVLIPTSDQTRGHVRAAVRDGEVTSGRAARIQ